MIENSGQIYNPKGFPNPGDDDDDDDDDDDGGDDSEVSPSYHPRKRHF